jgi:hypothetical protein
VDAVPVGEERVGEVAADEAGAAGEEVLHEVGRKQLGTAAKELTAYRREVLPAVPPVDSYGRFSGRIRNTGDSAPPKQRFLNRDTPPGFLPTQPPSSTPPGRRR